MQVIKLRKVDNSMVVTLPPSIVEALHLRESDAVAIEVVEDKIVHTKAPLDFQHAWDAYQAVDPRYHDANRKLAE